MKRLIFMALFTLLLVTACSHKHSTGDWVVDKEQHWLVCSTCDKKVESAAHTLDDDGICSICNRGIYIYEDDQTYDIITYDEQGAIYTNEYFAADGSFLSRVRIETEYYEDGNPKYSEEYHTDTLLNNGEEMMVNKVWYERCTNPDMGEVYMSETHIFEEDGSTSHYTYNEDSSLHTAVSYDPDGNINWTESYEYKYDANGNYLYQAIYTNDALSYECFYEQDEDFSYMAREVYYNPENGVVISDTTYDAEGNITQTHE